MMRITVIGLLLWAMSGMAQSDFVSKSFVKKDTVLLRWAPSKIEQFKAGLEYGYRIDRIEEGSGDFENNSTLTTITYDPAMIRLENFLEDGSDKKKQYAAFIDAFLGSSLKKEELSYMFNVLMLSAGADAQLAEVTNLRLVDSKVEPNKQYIYRIGILDKKRTGYKYGPFEIKVNTANLDQLPEFTTLTGEGNSKRNEAFLSWNADELQSDYAAYWVQRSTDKKNYNTLNKVPYFFFKTEHEPNKKLNDFVDSTAQQGETYYYRIQGISHFGEGGNYSNVVEVKMKRALNGYLSLDTVYADGFERVFKGTYYEGKHQDAKYLQEYILVQAKERNGNYQMVQSLASKEEKVELSIKLPIKSGDRNYYKLGAISVDGDTTYSYIKYFFTLDQEPPSQPLVLAGTIDKQGVVRLNWNANPEDDIQGYKVFRSNALKEEFVEITTSFAIDPAFSDTIPLNNLTSSIFYKVTAVDDNYNNSPHSEVLELFKPDSIPPVACVLGKYEITEKGLLLSWNNSTSLDVSNHQLMVKEASKPLRMAFKWNDSTSSFVDTLATQGENHEYYIVTTDKSGNETRSESMNIVYETGKRKGTEGISAEVDRNEKHIKLSWKKIEGQVYSIKIYRSKGDDSFKLIKTIRGNVNEYIDTDLYINNVYTYQVSVVFKSGISSSPGDPIEVVY